MNRERGRGGEEKKEKGKGEPVRMAKDFYFKIPIIYVMFKLIIGIANTTTTANFE